MGNSRRDEDAFYRAMLARDHRFDGKFFVGVKTTGIYCRPICPAKPKRENVEFFAHPLAAEEAGYRPCLRCRPESAPHSPAWIGTSAVVQRALKLLAGEALAFNEDEFAAKFGVSARHLRRLFISEIGKTPKQIAFDNRLNLARKLIVETQLPMTEVAFAAGFASVRRFNDAFRDRFSRTPSQLRQRPRSESATLKLSLSYRPPFQYSALIDVYRRHAVGELEWFEGERMFRALHLEGKSGVVSIANHPEDSCLRIELDFPDSTHTFAIVSRVRALFDLDSDPLVIANALDANPKISRILRRHPGIRLASGWDPFEVAVQAILGQLVSVERGRALVGDLIERFGTEFDLHGRTLKAFPSPELVAEADLSFLKSTRARKVALQDFARAVARGEISLDPAQDPEEFMRRTLAIKGIGPWTANYIALRGLRHIDAFPASDLILARALKAHSPAVIEKMRPWRGYVAALLWREHASRL